MKWVIPSTLHNNKVHARKNRMTKIIKSQENQRWINILPPQKKNTKIHHLYPEKAHMFFNPRKILLLQLLLTCKDTLQLPAPLLVSVRPGRFRTISNSSLFLSWSLPLFLYSPLQTLSYVWPKKPLLWSIVTLNIQKNGPEKGGRSSSSSRTTNEGATLHEERQKHRKMRKLMARCLPPLSVPGYIHPNAYLSLHGGT